MRGRVVAELAAHQHGLVLLEQLRALGFGKATVARMVREGRLHRVGRGVYAVGHPRLTPHGRWLAAAWETGPEAVLSHRSAAALWGIRGTARTKIDVTTPRRSGRAPAPHIDLHRTRRLHDTDVTEHDGIPVTAPARTLTDLADVLTQSQLRRALDEAEYLRLPGRATPIPGRRGTTNLLRATTEHRADNPTRTELERAFLDLLETHRLPRPEVNTHVETDRRPIEVDFLWRRDGLVAEVDGSAAHTTRRGFERDRENGAALARAGYRLVRFSHRQVRHERTQVARTVRALLYQTAHTWEESPTPARIAPP